MWLIYLMPHLEQALVKWSQPPHSGTKVEGRRAQAFKYDISIAWIRFHFNMKNGLKCSTKAKGIAFGRRKQIWPLLEHIFCFLLIHFWRVWQKIYTCRAENCLFSIANISEWRGLKIGQNMYKGCKNIVLKGELRTPANTWTFLTF